MAKEIIFSNLDELTNLPLVEKQQASDKWQKIPYEAGDLKGNMLVAGEMCYPEKLELDFKVKGYYKIYLCLGRLGNGDYVEVSLSGEDGLTAVMPSNLDVVNGVWRWAMYERAEEVFFKVADLTNQKLIINKPRKYNTVPYSSVILYVKLVEMTDEEVAEYKASGQNKVIQYHFDNDFDFECDYEKAEDYLGRFNMLEHGNGDSIIFEASFDNSILESCDTHSTLFRVGFQEGFKKYFKHKEEFKKLLADKAKTWGMDTYTGYRLGLGDFKFPYEEVFSDKVQEKYPECKVVLRDGTKIEMLSYAYPEARKFMIDKILQTTPQEFTGVSLFFHRLPALCGYEKPVLEEVEKRYGVDARLLPMEDERYYSVACEYGTAFIKELKEALKVRAEKEGRAPYKINVIVLQSLRNSLINGQDVETWVKEGLIDNFSQGHMCYWEQLDGCLRENGLVDLEKWTEKKKSGLVLKRRYDSSLECTLEEIEDFIALSEKYGVDFYAGLPWESFPAESFIEIAKALYEKGVKKLIDWNANHVAKKLHDLAGVKVCGDKKALYSENPIEPKKVVRITNFNGYDISVIDVNWKG